VTAEGRRRVLAVLANLASERYPGLRWEPVERDRPKRSATDTATRHIDRSEPGPADPDALRGQRTAASDDDKVDPRGQQPAAAHDIEVRPDAA
jgi:hypothetical protein